MLGSAEDRAVRAVNFCRRSVVVRGRRGRGGWRRKEGSRLLGGYPSGFLEEQGFDSCCFSLREAKREGGMVSGTGNLTADLKTACSIAQTWSGNGSGMMNVNAVLKDSKIMIPSWVINKCYGICFLFTYKAGFLWTGELGTGFVMSKINRGTTQERWSGPSAVTCMGMGYGGAIGGQKQLIVIVLNNKMALNTFASQAKVNFGADVGVAAGPVGREFDVKLQAGTKGIVPTYAYSFSQGLFAGASLSGTVVVTNPATNRKFYGKEVKCSAIIAGHDGLYEADANPVYGQLHSLLSVSLGGGNLQNFERPQPGGDSEFSRSGRPGQSSFDFEVSTKSSSAHAGADAFSRERQDTRSRRTVPVTTSNELVASRSLQTARAQPEPRKEWDFSGTVVGANASTGAYQQDYGYGGGGSYSGRNDNTGYGRGGYDIRPEYSGADGYDRGYGGRGNDYDRGYGGGNDYDRGYGGGYDYDRGYGGGNDYDRGYGGARNYDASYGTDRQYGDYDRSAYGREERGTYARRDRAQARNNPRDDYDRLASRSQSARGDYGPVTRI